MSRDRFQTAKICDAVVGWSIFNHNAEVPVAALKLSLQESHRERFSLRWLRLRMTVGDGSTLSPDARLESSRGISGSPLVVHPNKSAALAMLKFPVNGQ